MKTLKYILVAVALFALAISAQAQVDIKTTDLNGGTNNIAATTTNSTLTVAITPVRGQHVIIQPSFKLTGAGTSACVFTFESSADNSVWTTSHQLSITANGTSVVSGILATNIGATPFMRVRSITNPNATAITNLTVNYAVKPGI